MGKVTFAVLLFLVFTIVSGIYLPVYTEAVARSGQINNGIQERDILSVITSSNHSAIYAASSRSVYILQHSENRWEKVYSEENPHSYIKTIHVDPDDPEVLYIGSGRGLFAGNIKTGIWTRIFAGRSASEKSVLSVYVQPGDNSKIAVGTESGIYWTEDRGKMWHRSINLSSSHIIRLKTDGIKSGTVYAVTSTGLHKSIDSGQTWILLAGNSVQSNDENLDDPEAAPEYESEMSIRQFYCITADPDDSKRLFAGTSYGMLYSGDSGKSWSLTSNSGLTGLQIRDLVFDTTGDKRIFAATNKGVFTYLIKTETWEKFFMENSPEDLHSLVISSNTPPALWAAAEGGIYKSAMYPEYQTAGHVNAQEALAEVQHEPSIAEIRDAAIRYAEVSPQKISKWRKSAAKSAWLPDLRFAYDKNKDWQSSKYFYSTAKEKYNDDDITKGNDHGWSVSMTWQLGELIWNSDQTSIDSRSRYMVQLRDEILNEVTRLYFERKRLKINMKILPSEHLKEQLEDELRLQELTAQIDALTGSYLTRRLMQSNAGEIPKS
ncbi:MAG: hypothetical protein ISR96_03970 [Nitrospira sp.]|nr:hypothetical protein [bacterium]MBL7048670.1 hypothetical protein [Nitrospira sp.]